MKEEILIEKALIVEREILFKDKKFQGFLPAKDYDFNSIILNNHKYHERGDALENNFALQQIIPYVWIVNSKEKKVFAYRRAKKKQNYNETRLMNKISCGVGGHIEKSKDFGNPIENGMMRELREEVIMGEYNIPKVVGYLNDDSNSVGKVHFGIVAILETEGEVKKGGKEMTEGRFYAISELEEIFSDSENKIESWTRISWPFIKDYLVKL